MAQKARFYLRQCIDCNEIYQSEYKRGRFCPLCRRIREEVRSYKSSLTRSKLNGLS